MCASGRFRRDRFATNGKSLSTILAITAVACLIACAGPSPPPAPAPPQVAEGLVFYDWSGDLIEVVFDDFEEEYGVQITYVAYDSPEEAVANLRAGEVYDVVVLENQYLPPLIAEGLLAQIDYRNVPNFRNISPNFRDLSYDPACDFTGDGLINQGDLDLLMDAMYQPIEPDPVASEAITGSDLSEDGDGTEDPFAGPRAWRGHHGHGFRRHDRFRAVDKLFALRSRWW